MLKNTFIYLIGFPATGKYTIAKALCELEPNIKLVDNHLINNPIFGVLSLDGKTKLHSEIWNYVTQIWDIVSDVIINYADKESSFVFTNVLLEEDEADKKQYQRIKNIAEKRNGKFIPVLLTCSQDELIKRVTNEDRKARHKMLDVEGLCSYINKHKLINIKHKNLMTFDTSLINARDIALEINEACS